MPRCNCNQRVSCRKCYNSGELIWAGIKPCNYTCKHQIPFFFSAPGMRAPPGCELVLERARNLFGISLILLPFSVWKVWPPAHPLSCRCRTHLLSASEAVAIQKIYPCSSPESSKWHFNPSQLQMQLPYKRFSFCSSPELSKWHSIPAQLRSSDIQKIVIHRVCKNISMIAIISSSTIVESELCVPLRVVVEEPFAHVLVVVVVLLLLCSQQSEARHDHREGLSLKWRMRIVLLLLLLLPWWLHLLPAFSSSHSFEAFHPFHSFHHVSSHVRRHADWRTYGSRRRGRGRC